MDIKVDQLAGAMEDILADYAIGVSEAVEGAVDEAGKEALSVVREKYPVRTGRARKGWRTAKERTGIAGKLTMVTIYNAKEGSRVHLLQNGHQKAGGGRVEGVHYVEPAVEAAERVLGSQLPAAIQEV